MRLIRQRRDNDCGVAAVAMVCGVSYAAALAAFTPDIQRRMTKLSTGTTTKECAAAIRALGWQCDSRARPMKKRELRTLPGRAMLIVRFTTKMRHEWHWMAFDANNGDYKVLDPATRLQDYRVDSFIRVWRDEQ